MSIQDFMVILRSHTTARFLCLANALLLLSSSNIFPVLLQMHEWGFFFLGLVTEKTYSQVGFSSSFDITFDSKSPKIVQSSIWKQYNLDVKLFSKCYQFVINLTKKTSFAIFRESDSFLGEQLSNYSFLTEKSKQK